MPYFVCLTNPRQVYCSSGSSLLTGFLRWLHRRPLRFDPIQQRLRTVLPTDQFRVVLAPLLSEFAPEGFGEDGLGEVVDAGQGVIDLLFDAVGVGEELVYLADDFGLLFDAGNFYRVGQNLFSANVRNIAAGLVGLYVIAERNVLKQDI